MPGTFTLYQPCMGRRRAGAVEPVELAVHPYLCKGVAAQAIGRGFDNCKGGCSGNGGVHGVAAAAQRVQPRLSRQRLA